MSRFNPAAPHFWGACIPSTPPAFHLPALRQPVPPSRLPPVTAREIAYPEFGRRQLMLAGISGPVFLPMTRLSGGVRKNFNRAVIRPPGSVAEDEFLRRCIKCDQCIRVCPTNVLQPSLLEARVTGLGAPILISMMGWCELNCRLGAAPVGGGW